MSATTKPVNQKAWFLILPVFICVAFSAILPLMTVVNYSVQDIISPERRVFVGTEWFAAVMRDEDLHAALWNQMKFSLAVLLVEIPLGIALALAMPAQGWRASATLVIVALSLLIPWNVVGTIWQIFGRADIGLMGYSLEQMGLDYSYTGNATQAWFTVLLMDVWHWTPLVALLAYAGLRSIPDAYYQAARIDGANGFQVAMKIKLPNVRGAALLAMLLSIVGTIQLFNEPQIMSTADPGISKAYTPMMMAMNTSQGTLTPSGDGPASAIAIVMALIAGLLAVVYTLAERKVNE